MKNMKNENAVSPVIGVILMVVITVIIAAVLAVFAFGIGAPEKQAPDAALKITVLSAANGIQVTHGGGDSILKGNLVGSFNPDENVIDGAMKADVEVNDLNSNGYFDAGETAKITGTGVTPVAGQVARVIIVDSETGKPVMDASARAVP